MKDRCARLKEAEGGHFEDGAASSCDPKSCEHVLPARKLAHSSVTKYVTPVQAPTTS